MSGDNTTKLTRRQFAGALATAAAPMLLAPSMARLSAAPLPAQKKKEAKPEAKPAEPTPEERRERALKQIREFKVPDGAEPAFAFRAEWGR
ncbi:MAG: hypothetical protein ACRD4U_01830 [Candidatus Acidiferrales bacterium]